MIWCCFLLFGLGILVDFVLPTLWQQFGEGPFLFQHNNANKHKARPIQKWFVEIGVEELDWPTQSPDLNPIKQLWDELERRLQARRSQQQCPTSLMRLWLNRSKSQQQCSNL